MEFFLDLDIPSDWTSPLEMLRLKWGTVSGGNDVRAASTDMLDLDDQSLLAAWERARDHDTKGAGFGFLGMVSRSLQDIRSRAQDS